MVRPRKTSRTTSRFEVSNFMIIINVIIIKNNIIYVQAYRKKETLSRKLADKAH